MNGLTRYHLMGRKDGKPWAWISQANGVSSKKELKTLITMAAESGYETRPYVEESHLVRLTKQLKKPTPKHDWRDEGPRGHGGP